MTTATAPRPRPNGRAAPPTATAPPAPPARPLPPAEAPPSAMWAYSLDLGWRVRIDLLTGGGSLDDMLARAGYHPVPALQLGTAACAVEVYQGIVPRNGFVAVLQLIDPVTVHLPDLPDLLALLRELEPILRMAQESADRDDEREDRHARYRAAAKR